MDNFLEILASEVQKQMRAGQVEFKHDLSTISPSTNFMHGPTGIFGAPGIERDIFATRVKPRGLMSVLPSRATVNMNPVVGYLTGFTDDENGAEKDGVCDTPLSAGQMKSCLQGAIFGRIERKTEQIELNKLGRVNNRSEMFDLRIVNDPLLEDSFAMPGSVSLSAQDALNREVLAKWMNLGVAFERKLGPLVYTANPANNTAGGGYEEFWGLESLVGTGKVDVITNDVCSALDSIVRDANYARVDANINYYVRLLTAIYRYMQDLASRTGLDPVQWAFVMRRSLFNELVDLWPYSYATHRAEASAVQDSTIARVLGDARAERELANAMRTGQYLLIDGIQVPVIIDDFIPEDTNTNNANVVSGAFASDIYMLPLVVRGGIVSTYFEYFDFSQGVMQGIADGRLGNEFWSDGGRFLWTYQRSGWCVEWWAKLEPRLRLLTPHLAARIQNVLYAPLMHERDDDPLSAYFLDGGVTARDNAPYTSADF
ncbi:MAG TPA: hypothetical protein PKD55_00180 [Bellilinea sp.]|nr:hypothetical protein [Bellilinea sp.]